MSTPTENSLVVPKPQENWTKDDADKALFNSKYQFILSCA